MTKATSINDAFRRFANRAANAVGSPWAFIVAAAVCLFWGLTGPYFGFSDTWQLVINTSTTIVTFLMVFLIQNTQNRDAMAIHLKLDELLRALGPARTSLVHLENLSDEELSRLKKEFERLQERAGEVREARAEERDDEAEQKKRRRATTAKR